MSNRKWSVASRVSTSLLSIPISQTGSDLFDTSQIRELDGIDTESVSRKALAAGGVEQPAASASPPTGVTDRIVAMIGELSQ